MTQDENLCKETAKALIGYYSWHLDELLELYNAMGQTHEKDLSKLHLKIESDGAYIWMDFILISSNCKITVMEISSQLW